MPEPVLVHHRRDRQTLDPLMAQSVWIFSNQQRAAGGRWHRQPVCF
jgi:hypothetical protein